MRRWCWLMSLLACGAPQSNQASPTETTAGAAVAVSDAPAEGEPAAADGPATEAESTPEPMAVEEDSQAAPAAGSAPSVAAPTPTPAADAPIMPPQLMVTMAHLEEDIEAINAARPLLIRVRSEVAPRSEGAPLACTSGVRELIDETVRSGAGPAVSTMRSIRNDLDDLCGKFERWITPDERVLSQIGRYRARLERIEGWMNEIRRCIDPGPYNFRCENAYGAQEPGDAEQAAEALRVVAEVRGVIANVPSEPFPCESPLWQRIDTRTWTMSVARAQIPGLASGARSLCESIGVDAEAVNETVQDIRDIIDRSHASLIQLGNSRQDALLRLRATFRVAP